MFARPGAEPIERGRTMRKSRAPAVPVALTTDIDRALARVADLRLALDRVVTERAPVPERRRAHAELRAAFLEADALLRAATRAAKAHSFREGSRWRHRLSELDSTRQQHLFEESDDRAMMRTGSVRAVDTGMSGPAIGDFLHGECSPAGTPAAYGLDIEAILTDEDRTVARVIALRPSAVAAAGPPRAASA